MVDLVEFLQARLMTVPLLKHPSGAACCLIIGLTLRLMLYTMKVFSASSCCNNLPPLPAVVSGCLVRVVSESARFCMVHSMRPARTSRSPCRKGSRTLTCTMTAQV
eukprot:GHRR01023376.1.p1 GENE.GHRR01023376.1~~GHRR01023376.1.p1  ORF type:complete len:106 (-),score=8.44 GHRR01023376.1:383-700(-)